jgi:Domain of unknown function (DUF4062)
MNGDDPTTASSRPDGAPIELNKFDVFVSAVTSEFGEARDVVASDLRAKGYTVSVQEDFRQEGGSSTTLEKLDHYIRSCSAVVCIVGRRSGAVPPAAAAEPFAGLLPPKLTEASYTQWELILARHHRKRLFVYHATPEYRPDQPEPTGEDHPELQDRFVQWIFDEQGLDRDSFSVTAELQVGVLKADLGTVAGERRVASQRDAGLEVSEQRVPRPRRKDPVGAHRLKKNRHRLFGRDDELDDVLAAIEGRFENLILLVGEPGVGKKALLQEVSHSEELPDDFPDGVAISPLLTGDEDGEDFRQAIWEEFFETDDPSTVTPRRRLKDLNDIEALLVVPDIDPFVEFVPDVLEEMPDAWICASARSDRVQGRLTEALTAREDIPVGGLHDEATMLDLFEDRYRSEVPVEARADVVALCVEGDGNPAKIELLATDARRDARPPRRPDPDQPHPLIAWAAERRPAGETAELRKALDVADAVGTEVPRQVMAEVVGSTEAIDEALESGRLEEGSPRYRLNPVLEGDASGRHDHTGREAVLTEVFDRTLVWAEGAPLADLYANRAFILRMLEWGVAADDLESVDGGEKLDGGAEVDGVRERRRAVVRLGKAAEPAMSLGGRHGAWERLLGHVETAARADVERSPEPVGVASTTESTEVSEPPVTSSADALGWALHQRGSRALLRDELADARTNLNESLRYREDDEGRELTRRNLMLLPLAVVPFAVLLLVPLLIAAVTAAQVIALTDDEKPATIDITPDLLSFPVPDGSDDPPRLTVRNVGDGPVWFRSINVEEAGKNVFEVDRETDLPDRCGEGAQQPLAQHEECSIAIVLKDNMRVRTAQLIVAVSSRSNARGGDQTVVLVSAP